MSSRLVRGLRGAVKNVALRQQSKPMNCFLKSSGRNYMSDMRKSAFENNIVRLIRNEIQYELDRSPSSQHIPKHNSFKVDERPGEQWIRLTRNFGGKEEIKVEVTMFDGSLPTKKDDDDSNDVTLYVTLIVDIFKEEDTNILEFVCSAWPDSIEIHKVFTRGHERINNQPYVGPAFKELDDELQDSLYDFLEARGIDDKLAELLHQHIRIKEQNEYLRWMEKVKSFIQKK